MEALIRVVDIRPTRVTVLRLLIKSGATIRSSIEYEPMIGLTTAKSMKLSCYQTRGRRPRVDDMAVSHDEQLSNIIFIVQRHILVLSAHVTSYIGHVAPFRWIGFYSDVSQSRYS